MGLLINQGKQDTSKDIFAPIVENNVTLVIEEIKLSKTMANTLEVTERIVSGDNKNRFVYDRVTYDPKSEFSWKYRQLRKCAGVPYKDDEPAAIDIEALLLKRVLLADLKERKGKNKDGEETSYQAINYKMQTVSIGQPEIDEDAADFDEDTGEVIPEPQPKPEPKKVAKKTTKKVTPKVVTPEELAQTIEVAEPVEAEPQPKVEAEDSPESIPDNDYALDDDWDEE